MGYRHMNDLKAYIYETAKFIEEKISKNDVVVIEEAKHVEGKAFYLDDREKVLEVIESDPIVPHVATSKNVKYTFEEVFKSQMVLFTNLISTEFAFVLEFFDLKPSQCEYIFSVIFSDIAKLHLEWLEQQCNRSFDCISLLLIALITDEFKQLMKVRKINILDAYFHKVDEIIWP